MTRFYINLPLGEWELQKIYEDYTEGKSTPFVFNDSQDGVEWTQLTRTY